MVDKIKSPSPFQQSQLKINNKDQGAPDTMRSASSNEGLKQAFQNLSTAVSVKEHSGVEEKKHLKAEAKPVDKSIKSESESKLSSLNDAVRYSKEALSALEQVTAGNLNSASVSKLLSEDPAKKEGENTSIKFGTDRTPVGEIADDLQALKSNLKNLFVALKEKADQSNITIANREASSSSVEDLKQASEIAKDTSREIQFNPKDAMGAHNLSFGAVTKLLREENQERA